MTPMPYFANPGPSDVSFVLRPAQVIDISDILDPLCFGKLEVHSMDSKEILEQALALRPDEKFSVVEGILRSLDEPDTSLDAIWAEEAEKRLRAYRKGDLEAIPMKDVFKEK